MLKTIKKNVQMRLDELIKYCIENDIEDTTYSVGKNTLMSKGFTVLSDPSYKSFRVSGSGNFKITGYINKDDLFPVEIEEEITEDTKFYGIQVVYLDIDEQEIFVENLLEEQTILDVLVDQDDDFKYLQIYAMIDEKKELIWEADND